MARYIPDDDWRDEAEAEAQDRRAAVLSELDPGERAEQREAEAAQARRRDRPRGVPWQPSNRENLDSEGYAW